VLTLATLGTASDLFIASIVYLVKFRVRTISDALFVAVVIAVSVSVLLLGVVLGRQMRKGPRSASSSSR
jgi:hypothetical protein